MQAKSTANIYINGVAADATLKQLTTEARKLRAELALLSPESEKFVEKADRLKNVQARINDVNKELRQTKGFFGELQTELGKFGTMAVAYLGFEAITGQISNIIRKNAELSDSIADVMKTTGLTEAEAQKLNETLGKFDTRTARSELLELARDAGKLGITGKKEVEEFVRAADKINVALGEDLGKDAITQIGKLVSLFQLKEQFGLEQSMLKVASAMNTLGASSEASEGYITEFLNKMGGIAPIANISIDQVMALGATLDSLGQTVEVSSTALSKMFTKMASDATTYARIAGVSTEEFKKKMNDNALEAFMMVLEAAGKTEGGIVQLTETLGDLGIEGGRATGVFGVLAGNMPLLKKQMDIANKSFKEGSSVLDEFNTKNTNMAANLEKIQKAIASTLTSGMLSRGLKNMVNYFAGFIDPAETAIQSTQKLSQEVNNQLTILRNANLNAEQRKRLIDEINAAYGEYLPRLIKEEDTIKEIVGLQQQFNHNMTRKIAMMRYEEEMAEILKREHAAAEMLFNIEKKRGELNKDGLDANLFAVQTQQLAAQEALAKSVLANADDQIKALEDKYKSISDIIGRAAEEANNLNKNLKGGGTPKTLEQELALSEKMYRNEILLQKQMYAEGLLSKEEYERAIFNLEGRYIAEKVELHKKHKADTTKLETELYDAVIKQKEQNKTQLLALTQETFDEEQALLVKQLESGRISKEVYELKSQEIKTKSLEAQRALMIEHGENIDAVERQITESKAKEAKLRVGITADQLTKEREAKMAALELDLLNTTPDSNAELKAKLAILDEEKRMALENKELTETERLLIEKRYDEESLMLKHAYYNKVQSIAINTFMQIMGAIHSMNMNRLNNELQSNSKAHKAELDYHKNRLDKQLITEDEYQSQVASINEAYLNKERDIKREMFKREKRARIIEATMNTLTSVTRVLWNPPLAILAGVAGAINIAAIASQPIPEFSKGGFTGPGQGSPDKSGFKVAGVVHEDEYVVPQWMLRKPEYANVVDWLENQRVSGGDYEGFSEGGMTRRRSRRENRYSTTGTRVTKRAAQRAEIEGFEQGLVNDQAIIEAIKEQTVILHSIEHGVSTGFVIGDAQLWEMQERQNKLTKAQDNAKFR
ncbi:MAG: phage tail tape measure protein [Sphingobacteriaceae bacterium]|nr:phage tail tape measure protein [Sphingobacteriaceae bacterium]